MNCPLCGAASVYTDRCSACLEPLGPDPEDFRPCNGGSHGRDGWCGAPATVVCTDADGMQWYACDVEAHREGAAVEPIGAFLARALARAPSAGS